MLRFLMELLPCLLIGFWVGRKHQELSVRLAAPLVRFGVPISVMGLLLKGGLSGEMLVAAFLAVIAITVVLLVAPRLPGCQSLRRPSLRLGSCIGNTAYFGVPLVLAFLPPEALSVSIGYDLGATLLTWSVGPLFLGAGGSVASGVAARRWLIQLSASPATRGLLGALLVQWSPWAAQVTESLWLPSRLVILLALMVLGMRLGSLSRDEQSMGRMPSGLLPPLLVKLVGYPLLLLLMGFGLRLDPLMIQALALQGAAPTAISLLLIAESVERDQQQAAALVFWSTIIALFTAPVWGFLLPRIMLLQG